jgi:type II secretory pathway pseudopilin PulG
MFTTHRPKASLSAKLNSFFASGRLLVWRRPTKRGKSGNQRWSGQDAISLIEVLIGVVLVAVLVLVAMRYFGPQLDKARDGRRKSDLEKISIAFEHYYSDFECYPPPDILDNCGSNDLAPYLGQVPCDPLTRQPYLYLPHPNPDDRCSGFRVFAGLSNERDVAIARLGCDQAPGCGLVYEFGDHQYGGYNYGVSQGIPVFVGGSAAGGDPSPPPVFACCAPSGCNSWDGDPSNCPIGHRYNSPGECAAGCANPGGELDVINK